MKVLWVDYDGGIIGESVRDAYKSLKSDSFFTLVERTTSDYPSAQSLKEAVCKTDYWAAVYTSPDSSSKLGLAIAGTNTTPYDPSDVLTYIWNEARYPTVVDGVIASAMSVLSNAARLAFVTKNGTSAMDTIPADNQAAVSAFANPWILSSVNLQPTVQGTRAVYNTICVVLILIQDFFFLATLNGLYGQFQLYTKARPSLIIMVREIISTLFTMVGALLVTAGIWAFKAGWDVSGKQFALNWLLLWLFAHVNFVTLDVFSIWIPPQYLSMALITWVIINITSIILPFSLSSPFYRWGYALPAHAAYETLTDIWSNGCNPHLYFALPILFVYEISGIFWSGLGVYRRCHQAVIAEQAGKEAMRARIEAALQAERQAERRRSLATGEDAVASKDDSGAVTVAGNGNEDVNIEEAEKEEREDEIELDLQRLETRLSRATNFGPSFQIFGSTAD